MKKLLYLTDLSYQAKGRIYCKEDIYVTNQLKEYRSSAEDVKFAEKFIEWNSINHGIQRIDACKAADGQLLLVELEDLNPYLSLLELDEQTRNRFMNDFVAALENAAD